MFTCWTSCYTGGIQFVSSTIGLDLGITHDVINLIVISDKSSILYIHVTTIHPINHCTVIIKQMHHILSVLFLTTFFKCSRWHWCWQCAAGQTRMTFPWTRPPFPFDSLVLKTPLLRAKLPENYVRKRTICLK